MKNKKDNKDNKEYIDMIVDLPKENRLNDEKINSVLIVCLIFLVGLYFLPVNYTTVIASIVGSILSSSTILLLTLSNEKQQEILDAKKSANILAESINYIQIQLSQIDHGSRQPIYYPSDWLDYYANCSMILKYDYLEVLFAEFSYIEKINRSIEEGNETELKKLIESSRYSLMNETKSFNIFETELNLKMFASGEVELEPWNQRENYIKFSNYFYKNYKRVVTDLTKQYLNNHGRSEVIEVRNYIMNELRKDSELADGKYSAYISENRAILNEIFKVFLSFTESDSINLTWGKLFLKEQEDTP